MSTPAASKNKKDEGSTSTSSPAQPKITKDPRFRGARKLIESGRDGAIAMFGTLLEEARTKYGEASVETAPAYFEYGMALFRESQRQKEEAQAEEEVDEEEDEENEDGEEEEEDDDKKPAAKIDKKASTEDDNKNSQLENGDNKSQEEGNKGEGEAKAKKEDDAEHEDEAQVEVEEDEDDKENQDEEEEEDDEELAFSMMETAFAIYDQYVQLAKSSPAANSTYLTWAEREQLPRILSNIGDLLACMGKHADAADAYTRELAYRDNNLQTYENNKEEMSSSLSELMDRRKCVEANVLVATELLACEPNQDVVTTETKSCLVKGTELDDYATGYYEQARDQLQETVYLMAKLLAAAKDEKAKADLAKEKENICFASALVMGVGEKLAEREDEKMKKQGTTSTTKSPSSSPAKKKAKLS